MARRNHTFQIGEYYHCFNRGTDKRVIFDDKQDYSYFLSSMQAYNSTEVRGKLNRSRHNALNEKTVEVVSYCLLPNHSHCILKELTENGISKFMQRLSVGYTMYFNEKNARSGSLFQGAFKSRHIETDQDLVQLLSYVTYNYKIHSLTNERLYRSNLNTNLDICRDRTSAELSKANMEEIVDIITLQRLSFD